LLFVDELLTDFFGLNFSSFPAVSLLTFLVT
jgi:hypothetical protein